MAVPKKQRSQNKKNFKKILLFKLFQKKKCILKLKSKNLTLFL